MRTTRGEANFEGVRWRIKGADARGQDWGVHVKHGPSFSAAAAPLFRRALSVGVTFLDASIGSWLGGRRWRNAMIVSG